MNTNLINHTKVFHPILRVNTYIILGHKTNGYQCDTTNLGLVTPSCIILSDTVLDTDIPHWEINTSDGKRTAFNLPLRELVYLQCSGGKEGYIKVITLFLNLNVTCFSPYGLELQGLSTM